MKTTILFCLVYMIVYSVSLQAVAVEPMGIEWNDLKPVKIVEDPFEKLTPKQLEELAYMVRIRTLIKAEKMKATGSSAKEANVIEERLKKSGIDIPYLLSQREQVGRLRENQANLVQQDVLGKVIKLAGYVVPLKESGNRFTEFLLVPDIDSCRNSVLPSPNQAIYVRCKDGIVASEGRLTAVRVTGQIEAKKTKRMIQRTSGPTPITAAYAIVPDSIQVVSSNRTLDDKQQKDLE